MEKFQGWTATLSNGDTVWETEPVAGETSAWQKLLDRLTKENLKITSLRVQRGRLTLNALPNKKCDGYFQAYERHMSLYGQTELIRQGCGSVVGDTVFIQWIDTNGNIWADVRPLQDSKVHTTLRDT